ncbi:urease accessory protein UreD [Leisingera daeponensis]|uniref:urease accessory protein UreD n=1 Tax=Leisingera daeponensis TaxID=405746 RepID=UPI001C94A7D4|nr:urease accessory protein UreD [Leisingera daeponensis]MBY6059596.1 urease accessory protein UreD [Leisingera daeponensis]
MLPQLDLHFSPMGDGRTVIKSGYSRFPLRHSPAVYLFESFPTLTSCFVTNSSGGLFENDQLEICIRMDAGSNVQLLNLSATPIHKSDKLAACEVLRVQMGDDAYLELERKPLIPMVDSRYEQSSFFEIGRRSVAVIAETVFSGRFSSGERHGYTELKLGLDVTCSGERLVSERTGLRTGGGISALRSDSGWNCMGTVYCIGVDRDWKTIQQDAILTLDDPMIGFGHLPNNTGLIARFLCNSADAASVRIETLLKNFRSYFAEDFTQRRAAE